MLTFQRNIPQHKMLDHIDLNKQNGELSNLRPANKSQNNANVLPRNGRRFKGVTRAKTGRFRAQITFKGKVRHISQHRTEEGAARAYDEEALKCFGEFARLNFPTEKWLHANRISKKKGAKVLQGKKALAEAS